MPDAGFHLFVSYARADNEHGWVTALVEQLQKQFTADGAPEPLRPFFDRAAIREGTGWEDEILTGLRQSRAFLAILSPHYFASDWCRREWAWWTRHEMHRHCIRDGAAPIYFVTIPGFPAKDTPEAIATWIVAQNLRPGDPAAQDKPDIQRAVTRFLPRQLYDLHELKPEVIADFASAALREKLQRLSQQVREVLDRAERAQRSPTDLPAYNPAFTGRVDDLIALRRDLALGAAGITAVVHGLGGIGKTELALAYAHAYAHEYPGGRYLVKCAGAQDWRTVLERFADEQKWGFPPDVKQDATRHFALLLNSLHNFAADHGRCLLLCDNVDADALLREGRIADLRLQDDHFHLLFTTRLEAPNQTGATDRIHWLPLNSLPLEDAEELLDTLVPENNPAERKALAEIAKELDGFTIAVELTGRHLAAHREEKPSRLLAKLKKGLLAEHEREAGRSGDRLIRHQQEARLTFILSETLERLNPEENRILEYAAQFAPDSVPLAWLRELTGQDFPAFAVPSQNTGQEAQADSDEKWAQHYLRLLQLGLLNRPQEQEKQEAGAANLDNPHENPTALVSIHRLVQEVVRTRCGKASKDRQRAVYEIVKAACLFFRDHWHEAEWRWLLPIIEAFADVWLTRCDRGEAALIDDIVFVANDASAILLSLAEWNRAENLLRRALHREENHHGPNSLEFAATLSNLTQVLTATDRLAEAELLLHRALEIWKQNCGLWHPQAAAILNNLALLYDHTNRLAEAEPLLRQALEICEVSCGPCHSDVARGLVNLASLLQATNRLTEAEPLYRRALAIDEHILGVEHPKVAIDLNNLASLLQATNRMTEAEPLMRRALAIDEQSLGSEHPKIAIRLNNLATLLQATNRMMEAEPLMRRALAIDEQSYGPQHPHVAMILSGLAVLLYTTNRLAEAEPLMRRALKIWEQSYGAEHPEVALGLNNLASLLQHTNRLTEAESLMRRALAITEQSFGPLHPDVAASLHTLASLYYDTNRFAEAEPLMRRALEIKEQSFGPLHPEVALGLNNLASLLQHTNRLTEAESLMRRALAIMEQSFGPLHPDVAVNLNNLASLYFDTDRLAKAEPLFRRALKIDEQSYGPRHPNVARDFNNLAKLLEATNRLLEAESLMRKALEINEQSFGPLHPEVAMSLNNLASLLMHTGRPQEAEPLIRQALAIDEQSYGPQHPKVATALNNLATLLFAANQLAEAELLMRRQFIIFAKCRVAVHGEYPPLRQSLANYYSLLIQSGQTEEEAEERIRSAMAEGGLRMP